MGKKSKNAGTTKNRVRTNDAPAFRTKRHACLEMLSSTKNKCKGQGGRYLKEIRMSNTTHNHMEDTVRENLSMKTLIAEENGVEVEEIDEFMMGLMEHFKNNTDLFD